MECSTRRESLGEDMCFPREGRRGHSIVLRTHSRGERKEAKGSVVGTSRSSGPVRNVEVKNQSSEEILLEHGSH